MTTGTKLATTVLLLGLIAAGLAYYRSRADGPRPQPADAGEPAAGPTDSAAAPRITVYFSRGESSATVLRAGGDGATGPEAALRALLAGPTAAERANGIDSWFSAETAGQLRSLTIDGDGVAHVDFLSLATAIPSASSSAGSQLLLRELNTTLFQFPEIRAIEYTIGGSCEAFWNWLQYDCEVVRRGEWD